VGNTVTLSYRQAAFSRIKDRNAKRLEEFTRKGKLKVIFNSKVNAAAKLSGLMCPLLRSFSG
jgi:hypothetical protein